MILDSDKEIDVNDASLGARMAVTIVQSKRKDDKRKLVTTKDWLLDCISQYKLLPVKKGGAKKRARK